MNPRAEYLGPARRRPLVLDAAEIVFAEGGYADASMQTIADRSGASKSVLYDVFPGGKQEIFFSVLERAEQRFADHVPQASDAAPPTTALRSSFTALLTFADRYPHAFRLLFGDAGTSEADIARRVGEVQQRVIASVGAAADALAGVSDTRLDGLHRVCLASIVSGAVQWSFANPEVSRDLVSAAVVDMLALGFERVIERETPHAPAARDGSMASSSGSSQADQRFKQEWQP